MPQTRLHLSNLQPPPTTPIAASGRFPPPPFSAAQLGTITGTVIDAQDEVVPGAAVTLDGPRPTTTARTVANDLGAFQFADLKPGVDYRLTISAKGFVDWSRRPSSLFVPASI